MDFKAMATQHYPDDEEARQGLLLEFEDICNTCAAECIKRIALLDQKNGIKPKKPEKRDKGHKGMKKAKITHSMIINQVCQSIGK